ncbi:hypothetical protein JXB28_05145 [Candidatus Woesearchaeota archaeon]|nr:hypothetical protein [Candidatus Woesearchaeota archaeon]
MNDDELNKRIKKGAVLAQVAFEIIGNPKEHVAKTLKDYLEKIKKTPELIVLDEEIGEPEAIEGGLWSTYADTEILFDKLDKLVWLSVNFMPASIEITAPEDFKLSDKDLTLWLNDLISRLHEIAISVRQTTTTDDLLVKSMNALIQNSVLLAAEAYHNPKEIAEKIGINEEQLKPFFEGLVKNGKLEKKKEEYFRKGFVKGVGKSGAKKRN